jgi:hypothetical protein
MTVIQKHSRMPRKYNRQDVKVAKRQLAPDSLHKLTGQDPMDILKRYLSDESTQTIAGSYGVTRQALVQWLLRNAEEPWKEAQVARAIARKEKAEDEMELAQDPLTLARARELLKAAQWDLERTCRRIYGEDRLPESVIAPTLTIQVQMTQNQQEPARVQVALAHAPGRLIEGETAQESVSITQQTPINGT